MSTWTRDFDNIHKSSRYFQYHSAFESNQSENNFIYNRTIGKEIDSMIQNEMKFEIIWSDHLWMELLSILFKSKAKCCWRFQVNLRFFNNLTLSWNSDFGRDGIAKLRSIGTCPCERKLNTLTFLLNSPFYIEGTSHEKVKISSFSKQWPCQM